MNHHRMPPERFQQLARLPADTRHGPERELWDALLAERMGERCVWVGGEQPEPHGGSYWVTGCGVEFNVSEHRLTDAGFNFCPNCGGDIEVKEEGDG